MKASMYFLSAFLSAARRASGVGTRKISMYFNYTTRSLVRGGQRTMLAVFCVAVGVMAIVALQLVGLMINNAFDSNVRDANGGDIAVTSENQPFTQDDLAFFKNLKNDGKITDYTASINAQGTVSLKDSLRQSFSVRVVDPANYPVVTPPTFTNPKDGAISNLLKNNQVVVTQPFIDQYKKKIGDTFELHVGSREQNGRTIPVKLAGIVSDSGVLAQSGSVLLISLNDYKAAAPKLPLLFDTVNVTTANQAQTDQAVKQIQANFPIASARTAKDALSQQQDTIDNIKKFLEIAGLLALLIGGVGIVNTMQVLLSRRKTEIAMLKTTGYRRFDLYLLFGLEAGLLGLVGGALGAGTAIGVSYLVRNLVQQTFGLNIPFTLDQVTIFGGLVIGLVTALIFGLMPIVQAANIRPLNVIRELPEGRGATSIALTILLLVILSVLFCGLAIFILSNDVFLGVVSVYGTFVFLGLLSLFFGLVVLIVSKLPVPERFNLGYLTLVLVGVALSALLYHFLPPFGILLLLVSLLGFVVVLMPRTWKATIKMALRNLDRQRARTTTTMLALFVGIFTIGLIIVLGQNLRDQVNRVIATTLNYNVISITSGNDTTKLQNQLTSVPGLSTYRHRTLSSTVPVAINDQPIATLLPTGKDNPSANSLGRGGTLYFLSGIEGYDVGNNQFPSTKDVRILAGRNLNADDAGTDHVLIAFQLANLAPLHLKVGDQMTLAGLDRVTTRTVTVVGIYRPLSIGNNIYPLLGTTDTTRALSPAGIDQSIFYMRIDPNKLNNAIDIIGNAVPNAFVLNLANIGDIIDELLNDVLLTLTTIASLSLLAGVIIIANAVALAMLERRRELGILKSVGYTSGSILSEVLIENGLVGGVGALLAMLLVTLATSLLGTYVFKSNFGVDGYLALALVVGSALLAMLTAALVAWGSVRVRPLEVLRYE
ncbi:MAG TPA: FtsX-like permease family protein [Ktedonobacteraceae bacterium]|nr:FtsX-like permease family protein [Ktedonobacteraceae bacterium]